MLCFVRILAFGNLLWEPSREFNAPMMAEEEIWSDVNDIDATSTFSVVDLADEALAGMREYDTVADFTEAIIPYLGSSAFCRRLWSG